VLRRVLLRSTAQPRSREVGPWKRQRSGSGLWQLIAKWVSIKTAV